MVPPCSDQLRKQQEGRKREASQYSLQLAHRHEERDKALVDIFRLEEVASLVRKEQGVKKRVVSLKPHCRQSALVTTNSTATSFCYDTQL